MKGVGQRISLSASDHCTCKNTTVTETTALIISKILSNKSTITITTTNDNHDNNIKRVSITVKANLK